MSEEQRGDVLDYLAAVPISNARQLGVQCFGLGMAILAINAGAMLFIGRYYPLLFPFAFPGLLAGLCLFVVGQPRSSSGTPALWGRVLLVASATLGIGIGVGLTFLLLRPGW